MKGKRTALICMLAMLLCLTGCRQEQYEGSMVRNEEEFQLEYSLFDGTETHSIFLEAGERLQVEIRRESGVVSLAIGMEGEEPVYTGRNLRDASFSVGAGQTGEYRIEAAGDRARGSMNIRKDDSDE